MEKFSKKRKKLAADVEELGAMTGCYGFLCLSKYYPIVDNTFKSGLTLNCLRKPAIFKIFSIFFIVDLYSHPVFLLSYYDGAFTLSVIILTLLE